LDELLYDNVQLVVLGTGDYKYEELFKSAMQRYPGKVSANIRFDNALAHKIYAACDLFLMPSLFEPCGLGQLISLRYGTLPIVRETGGLKDTVLSYNDVTKEDIEEILSIVKLIEFKNEKVSKFSLGMKQRLALAMALLSKPKLVILDEPTNGLDIEGTVQMRNLIIELAKEKGITFFVSSHLVHEVELMCGRAAIIHNGRLTNNGEEMKYIRENYASLEDFYMQEIKKGEVKNG
jgi:ABC-type branched-subunit amino acid transport system ATPase component